MYLEAMFGYGLGSSSGSESGGESGGTSSGGSSGGDSSGGDSYGHSFFAGVVASWIWNFYDECNYPCFFGFFGVNQGEIISSGNC